MKLRIAVWLSAPARKKVRQSKVSRCQPCDMIRKHVARCKYSEKNF
ncbi:MAG: hypothetical protein U0800_06095 [Isosphaeraceae bacterium]